MCESPDGTLDSLAVDENAVLATEVDHHEVRTLANDLGVTAGIVVRRDHGIGALADRSSVEGDHGADGEVAAFFRRKSELDGSFEIL